MKPNEEEEELELDIFEEDEKGKKIMLIISGVFVVAVAAILCFFLWKLLHPTPADGNAGGQSFQESVTPQPEEDMPQSEDDQASLAGGTEAPEEGSSVPDSSQSSEVVNDGGSGSQSGEAVNDGRNQSSAAVNNGGNSESNVAGNDGADKETNPLDMQFQEAADTVTAKKETNLRSEPSTARDDTVVVKLKNGETVSRTGINQDTGWSRLEYNGQTLYAVSRYLTDELTPKPAESSAAPDVSTGSRNLVTTKDGRTVQFTDCDDTVSPKMEVNLRGEPSTSEGNATIHVRLLYGEKAHRTGYSGSGSTEEDGWSRVEYNGEVLYAKTSYLFVVDETQQEE